MLFEQPLERLIQPDPRKSKADFGLREELTERILVNRTDFGRKRSDQVKEFVVLPKRWIVDARTMSTG